MVGRLARFIALYTEEKRKADNKEPKEEKTEGKKENDNNDEISS